MRSIAASLAAALLALLAPASVLAQGPSQGSDLSVAMIDAPDPVGPGRVLTYRIAVSPRGNRASTNVSVATSVPAGTTFEGFSGPPTGWTFSTPEHGGTGPATAMTGSLQPGRTVVFQFTVRVSSDMPDGATISNTVTVSSSTTDPTPDDNSAATTTTVRDTPPSVADLSVQIEFLQEMVPTLGQIVAMITVRNDGPMTATNLGIGSMTPDGTVFVSATSSHGPVTAPEVGGTGDVLTQVDALAADGLATVTAVFRVTAQPGTRIEGRAMVAAFSEDPDPRNNVAHSMALVVPQGPAADVSIAFSNPPTMVVTNSDLSYSVLVSNAGPVPAEDTTAIVPIPRGARFLSATPDRGNTRTPPPGREGAVGWKPGPLAAGDSATLTVTVRVGAGPGAPLVTTALVTSRAADPDLIDNVAIASTRVQSLGDAVLQWDPPDLTSSDDTPPPVNVVVDANAEGSTSERAHSDKTARADSDPPVCYNVYTSDDPNVETTPENLLTTVPANQTTTTVPVAPGGSFFTVTATYGAGESSASNTDGTGDQTGADLTSVKVSGSKITAKGSGFTDTVEILLDGIPFADAAKVKGGNSKAVQKGSLVVNLTIEQYLATGTEFLVIVRNSDGSVSTWTYVK